MGRSSRGQEATGSKWCGWVLGAGGRLGGWAGKMQQAVGGTSNLVAKLPLQYIFLGQPAYVHCLP